jgi:WD40 repeat protein
VKLGDWWKGALASLALTGVALAAATSIGPFTLLTGQEVARTVPIRDLDASVFGFDHDGGSLLAADAEGPALLDERGQVRTALRCPAGPVGTGVVGVAGARAGGLVAALFANGRACVWDGGTLLGMPGRNVTQVALGAEDTLVYGHESGVVEGRNPRTGRRRWARDPDLGPIDHLRFEPSGLRVAASAANLGVAIFDTRWGRLVRALRGEPAWSAAFDPSGDRLAVGRANGRVELWNTTTWRSRDSVDFGNGRVVDLDFSPKGDQLAAALETGEGADRVVTVEVWEFAIGELVLREEAPHGPGPARFRYDRTGDHVVAGNGPGAGRLWGTPGARQIPRPPSSFEPPHQRPLPEDFTLPPLAPVAAVAVPTGAVALNADGTRLLVRVEGERAALGAGGGGPPAPSGSGAEVPSGATAQSTTAPKSVPTSLAPAKPTVSARPAPVPGLAVIDPATGGSHALEGSAVVSHVAFAPEGRRAAGWTDGKVVVWDTDSGAAVAEVTVAEPRAIVLAGARAAVVNGDGTVALVGADGRLKPVPGVTDATIAAFDPAHASRIGVGTAEGGVRIVDTRKGTSVGSWGIHKGAVSALAFSADGHYLATAGPRPGGPDAGAAVTMLVAVPEENEDPWTAVVDTLPSRLRFSDDGRRVLVVTPRGVDVVDHAAGVVLDLSAPVVDAAFAGGDVAWVDAVGGLRHAAVGATALPTVPRGRAFAVSEDRRFAVTVDGDGVSVWNDLTGRLLRALPGTGEAVLRCVFDDSGDRLAVLYEDRSIEVYDVATGDALRHLDGPPAERGSWARFSDDGTVLWMLGDTREVVGWDITTGAARERIAVPGAGPITVDEALGRSRFVHLTDAAGPGAWLDTAAASPLRLTLPADGFRPIAIPPKGDRMAVVEPGGVARWDVSGRRRVGPLLVVDGAEPGVAAAFSPDGASLAVAYRGGLVRVWDLTRNAVIVTLGADGTLLGRKGGVVSSLAFDATGDLISARDPSGRERAWGWRLSDEVPEIGVGAGPVQVSRDIPALALSPDGQRLYSAHGDGNIRAWSLATGEQSGFFWGHAARVTTLAVAADGRRLVSGSEDGTVRAWDTELAVERVAINTFGDPVRRLAASADGWRFAAVGDGGVLRTWDGALGRALRRWTVGGGVAALDLGDKGDKLGVTIAGGGGWVLDPATGTVAAGAAVAPPGSAPGSGASSAGGGAPPRNAPPGGEPPGPPAPADPVKIVRALAASLAPISAEARSLDGGTLVTAGTDGQIRLWDVATRSCRGVLNALTDGSWVVDRADGTRFASESLRDGTSPLLFKPMTH